MKKKVLLTAFEPFGKHQDNSTLLIPKKYQNLSPELYDVRVEVLPVEYARSAEKIEYLLSLKYDLVLLFGMAASRDKITIERFAMNVMDCSLADNTGYIASNEKIEEKGELALETLLDIKDLIKRSSLENVAASYTAGLYVCNTVFYKALYLQKLRYPESLVGFIHLPEMIDSDNLQIFIDETIKHSLEDHV